MALTCPKCDKTNNCDCSNCDAQENLVIIDYENDMYQFCHCGHKFDEQDSLDHDWDNLIKRFAQLEKLRLQVNRDKVLDNILK